MSKGWFNLFTDQLFGTGKSGKKHNRKRKQSKNYNDEFYVLGPKGELVFKINKKGKVIR